MRDSNLTPDFTARWYRVREPFKVLVATRMFLANTWVGSARVLGNIFEIVTVNPGDAIYAMPGGIYVQQGEEVFPARISTTGKGLFEKMHDKFQKWPLEKLKELGKPGPLPEITLKCPEEVTGPVGVKIGRSDDYADCAPAELDHCGDTWFPKEEE